MDHTIVCKTEIAIFAVFLEKYQSTSSRGTINVWKHGHVRTVGATIPRLAICAGGKAMNETMTRFFLEQAPLLAIVGAALFLFWREFRRYQDEQYKREIERMEQQRLQLQAQGVAYKDYVDRRDEKLARMLNEQTHRWQDFLDNQSKTQREWIADLVKQMEQLGVDVRGLHDTIGQQGAALDTIVKIVLNGWREKIQTGPLDESKAKKK